MGLRSNFPLLLSVCPTVRTVLCSVPILFILITGSFYLEFQLVAAQGTVRISSALTCNPHHTWIILSLFECFFSKYHEGLFCYFLHIIVGSASFFVCINYKLPSGSPAKKVVGALLLLFFSSEVCSGGTISLYNVKVGERWNSAGLDLNRSKSG